MTQLGNVVKHLKDSPFEDQAQAIADELGRLGVSTVYDLDNLPVKVGPGFFGRPTGLFVNTLRSRVLAAEVADTVVHIEPEAEPVETIKDKPKKRGK